jgi:hypothetical protein
MIVSASAVAVGLFIAAIFIYRYRLEEFFIFYLQNYLINYFSEARKLFAMTWRVEVHQLSFIDTKHMKVVIICKNVLNARLFFSEAAAHHGRRNVAILYIRHRIIWTRVKGLSVKTAILLIPILKSCQIQTSAA